MNEDNLRRLRRQRAMQHLEYSTQEAIHALKRIRADDGIPFGPAIMLAYSLEHARASLEVLAKVVDLPDNAKLWLREHGDSVRLFRNRVDHYDEDLERKDDFEAQAADALGISIATNQAQLTLRIKGRGREFDLEALKIVDELSLLVETLEDVGHNSWRAPL